MIRTSDRSVFQHYQRLIDVRNAEETLVYGEFELLLPNHDSVFAYARTRRNDRLVVVLNWDDEARNVDLPGLDDGAEPLACNYADAPAPSGLDLRPYEAVVFSNR